MLMIMVLVNSNDANNIMNGNHGGVRRRRPGELEVPREAGAVGGCR